MRMALSIAGALVMPWITMLGLEALVIVGEVPIMAALGSGLACLTFLPIGLLERIWWGFLYLPVTYLALAVLGPLGSAIVFGWQFCS